MSSHRAYSLFTIKALDGERRLITGTATTPTPDRVGDIVEPLGVKFTNPLPLLLFHDSKQPVGHVRFKQATKDGIDFEAHIPQIADPPSLKDRVDSAWGMVKAGLIKGVSIGFRSIEESYNKETQGFRFIKSEVFELSLVTVPANADATIATIKSLDTAQLAALRPAEPPPLAGVSAHPRPEGRADGSMKNLNEQIAELQTSRVAVADRMKAIMDPALANEGALDAAQETEYDGLAAKLKTIDTSLSRFTSLEQATMPRVLEGAKAVEGTRPSWGYQRITVSEPELPPGIAFTRAIIAKVASRLEYRPAADIAAERYPSHPSIANFLKTNIPGGTTTGGSGAVGSPGQGWGLELATQNSTFVAGFMDYLRPQTIVGRLNLTRTPFNVRIQSQTTGGSANWVGQTKQKPVTFYDFDVTTLGIAKLAAICVLAEELIRFSTPSAEARVRDQLARTITDKLDQDFIDPDIAAVANVSPASITRGISPRTPSGTNLAAVMTDIQTIINLFVANNVPLTNLAWIMPQSVAVSLSLMLTSLGSFAFPTMGPNGGTLAGFPVVTSQWANNISTSPTKGNLVILINQTDIFLADDGGVTVDASNQASIEMSDNPENEVGSVVSMYQTNQVALRAERYINWVRGRTSAVQLFGNVLWSA